MISIDSGSSFVESSRELLNDCSRHMAVQWLSESMNSQYCGLSCFGFADVAVVSSSTSLVFK